MFKSDDYYLCPFSYFQEITKNRGSFLWELSCFFPLEGLCKGKASNCSQHANTQNWEMDVRPCPIPKGSIGVQKPILFRISWNTFHWETKTNCLYLHRHWLIQELKKGFAKVHFKMEVSLQQLFKMIRSIHFNKKTFFDFCENVQSFFSLSGFWKEQKCFDWKWFKMDQNCWNTKFTNGC